MHPLIVIVVVFKRLEACTYYHQTNCFKSFFVIFQLFLLFFISKLFCVMCMWLLFVVWLHGTLLTYKSCLYFQYFHLWNECNLHVSHTILVVLHHSCLTIMVIYSNQPNCIESFSMKLDLDQLTLWQREHLTISWIQRIRSFSPCLFFFFFW